MSFLRQWLLGITAAALAAALAQALTPEGTVKKLLRLTGGLVLLLAVVRPLKGLAPAALPRPGDLVPSVETAETAGEEVMKTLIAQKVGAYIVDKGSALGCPCTAQVTVAEDGSGWAVPWSVEVRGQWTAQEKKELSRLIAQELNIPEERQTFLEETP